MSVWNPTNRVTRVARQMRLECRIDIPSSLFIVLVACSSQTHMLPFNPYQPEYIDGWEWHVLTTQLRALFKLPQMSSENLVLLGLYMWCNSARTLLPLSGCPYWFYLLASAAYWFGNHTCMQENATFSWEQRSPCVVKNGLRQSNLCWIV